jgi:hypothetical protein
MNRWLARLRRPRATPRPPTPEEDVLWAVTPPEGVRLRSSRPARTGQGGQGLVARYSDGTTAMALLNSDGSLSVLFFRRGEIVPAVPLGDPAGRRFTWKRTP